MGFAEISLIVSIVLTSNLAYGIYVEGRERRKFPVASGYECPCGTKVKVSGYSEEVTRRVIERVRQIHDCEERS